ncbi:MAG TPA: TolC family protein, partial [Agriterribacter sp.]|nr:TolC family protein [Agriterribacter sp.]
MKHRRLKKLKNIHIHVFAIMAGCASMMDVVHAQDVLSMNDIKIAIEQNHPSFKMLDAEARAMDEAAKGAHNWAVPELGAGFYQTPYNVGKWQSRDGMPGMGMFMISAQQMFPNRKKQDADFTYMSAQSSIQQQTKDVVRNELLYTARKNYYDWVVLEKKLKVLDENDKLLRFMMQSAEIRYKNGLGKISAYYKAKAALSNVENMKLLFNNEIAQKRIAINTVMNRDVDMPFVVDTNYAWIDFNRSMFDSSALLTQRSDIKVLNRSMEVNDLERKAELAKLKPEFGIRYDHMATFGGQ